MATMTQSDGKASILDNRTKYTIPIYQREYSWGWEQISRFVGDIFKGFWGAEEEKRIICEPMFIGTMQLSEKKETGTNKYTQDVIDGQQRLSTMMCIFNYLKLKYPENKALGEIRLDWLETRVNNGKEQESLEAMLGMSDLDGANMDNEQNPYVRSIGMIDECFNNLTTDENGEPMEAFTGNIGAFVEYLLNDIYFVVIETTAGLSKTIQIFNTINTAGLDLNGDDLFKVRLYEYLHDVKGHGEDSFTEIGGIYKDVKKRNEEWLKTHGWDLVNMGVVRTVYKDYLISKHKLPVSLYAMGTDTFFERLFDVLLNVQSHKEMASAKTVELALDDLRRIINAVCFWNESEYRDYDEYITYTLITRSRYDRYADIAYQILLSNEGKTDGERLNDVYDVMRPMCRVFFCYSLMYARQIYEIHDLMHRVYQMTADFQTNKGGIITKLSEKASNNDIDWFKSNCIGQAIAYNRVWKDIVCLLSAYLDERDAGTPLDSLMKKFAWGGYDIEHIHANANTDEGADIDETLQNGIGNLMLLEPDINRSISNLPFREKTNRADGKPCYKDSRFASARKVMQNKTWGKEEIIKRKEDEIRKISEFLFN